MRFETMRDDQLALKMNDREKGSRIRKISRVTASRIEIFKMHRVALPKDSPILEKPTV